MCDLYLRSFIRYSNSFADLSFDLKEQQASYGSHHSINPKKCASDRWQGIGGSGRLYRIHEPFGFLRLDFKKLSYRR